MAEHGGSHGEGPAEPERQAAREVEALVVDQVKLARLTWMAEGLLGEVQAMPLDAAGRVRLRCLVDRLVVELGTALSEELVSELSRLVGPLETQVPSDGEVRVVEAQLVGWLEGLLFGLRVAAPASSASS